MDKNKRIFASVALFLIMFILSMIENIKGVIIPQIKDYFNVNATQISLMLTLSSISYVGSTYFVGNISERFGRRLTEALGILLVLLGSATIALTDSFSLLLLGLIVINLGLGCNGVIINVVVPMLFITYQSVMVNSVHFMYGLGATFGQRIAGYLITIGWDFQKMYLYFVGILVVLWVISWAIYYPEFRVVRDEEQVEVNINPFRDQYFWYIALGMALYVFAETGLNNWLVDYLKVTQSMSEDVGSQFISAFFLLIALGRLLGGFIVDKIGRLRSIMSGVFIGTVLLVIGIILKGPFNYLISLAGLFYSIVFPTSVIMVSNLYQRQATFMTSKILTFTFAGNMILNQFVGILTDWLGFSWSIFMMPLAGGLSLIIYWRLNEKLAKQERLILR